MQPTLYLSFEVTKVLAGMERDGIKIDRQALNLVKDEYTKELEELDLFLNKEGKVFFETAYNAQKKRIFNALKNSDSDSVIKFKEVLKKIIDGK